MVVALFSLKKLPRWIPALLLMGLIFWFSSQPGGDSGNLSKLVLDFMAGIGLDVRSWFGADNAFFLIRKAAHFTEYFLLALALGFAIPADAGLGWRRWLWIGGIGIFYAASDEFHQLFVPGRVGDVMDVGIDALGVIAAMGWLALFGALRKRFRK